MSAPVAALFAHPIALPALLAAPVVWLALVLLDRWRARRLASLVGPRMERLAAERSAGRRRLRRWVFAAGLLLALAAAMGPAFGATVPETEWRGVDMVVCLDVSRSMLAGDVEPSRLAHARREIRLLAEQVRADRLGLVVFAGEARLLVPLTSDAASLADLVNLATPSSVRRGGTDLGAALEAARAALDGARTGPGAVLLLTDGEDLGGRGLAAAAAYVERGVPVHCVGFGSALGSKIAIRGEDGARTTFLKDRDGADVVSVLDAEGLERIAVATGGTYVAAERLNSTGVLRTLYEDRILPLARATHASAGGERPEDRFQWFLLVALAFWMLDLCLTDRTRR